jgi:hypothetical protein
MKTLTYLNLGNWSNNEPFNSESYPETSILPERFRSISEPSEIPLTSDDLNSITIPLPQVVSIEG